MLYHKMMLKNESSNIKAIVGKRSIAVSHMERLLEQYRRELLKPKRNYGLIAEIVKAKDELDIAP